MSGVFDGAWDVLKARRPTPMRRFYKKPTQTTAGAPAAQQDVGQPVPSASQNVDIKKYSWKEHMRKTCTLIGCKI